MKRKYLLFVLLLPFFAAKCEKDEKPNLPACDYVFECKVNGQTWKPKARWNCPDIQVYYTPDTIGNWIGGRMIVIADQCQTDFIGRSSITIHLDSLYLGTLPKLTRLKYVYVDEEYASIPLNDAIELYDYDSILTYNITIQEFVPDNYSKDYTGGYVNMNFSATLVNGVGDTVEITNGKICQRFQ